MLAGELEGMIRYRVGDYRLICQLEDQALTILVIEVGHRREIYR
jgi:mRNA interferase RelE/StbE